MTKYTDYDNRSVEDVNNYLEARVEALKRRIKELEEENQLLKELVTT